MANESKFVDPIDELMNRFASTESSDTTTAQPILSPRTPEDVQINRPVETIDDTEVGLPDDDDIDYGDDDLANQIEEEEAAEEAARRAAAEEAAKVAAAERPVKMPEQSLDPQYQSNAIGFETNKIAIVTTMVNKVIAKHHLTSGGIPDDKRMQIMGELVEQYYTNGEVITPEFEDLILKNWVGGQPVVPETDQPKTETPAQNSEEPAEEDRNTTININVEPGTPVTVNIDGEVMDEVNRAKKINVVVHEVSELDMRAAKVIENTQQDGIITPYESSATDMPITLPMSAYRCSVSGVSLFDIIKLSSLQSGNQRDLDIKTWQLIYKHVKNVSIGEFKTFDDFLKHTDYRDLELLLWAMFVATADETETIRFKCGNPKCDNIITVTYNPRSIIHISDELIPDYYKMTHQVPSGKAALEHWKNVHSRRKLYELPESKVLVELDDYSAWDYHNIKMPIMQEVYMRYRPDDPEQKEGLTREEEEEMNFTLLFLLYIKAITINKDGTSYKYTNWHDIEKIVSSHISNKDISVLIAIIQEIRQQESPVAFYIENVVCDKCGRSDDRIPVNDIMRSLFFQLSSGLTNTSVNFVQTELN